MATKFAQQVYDFVAAVPAGRVTTYRLIAKAVGRPKAYRAVGNALNKNPKIPDVPCHRVVLADGRLGGYRLGRKKKTELLCQEGVEVTEERIVKFIEIVFPSL